MQRGCEEFTAELALGLGELAEEVLVDAAERVASFGTIALEADVGDQVDQPLHLLRRDAATGVVARQLALEVRVVALDSEDGVVDQRGDVGPRGLVLEVLPACLGRYPEDPLGGVLVAVLQQAFDLRPADAFSFQFPLELAAPRLKRVGNVLQEEQAEDDMLVLGSVDLTAQGVGQFPEDFGVCQVGGGCVIVRHAGFSPLLFGCQTPGHSGRYMCHGDIAITHELKQFYATPARAFGIEMYRDCNHLRVEPCGPAPPRGRNPRPAYSLGNSSDRTIDRSGGAS